ncbi:MAG: toll/interleukin-1 receptor domain-containing protein [Blastocatellia bacterium]
MQVFISHSGETEGLVRRIAKALEEEGLRAWDPYFEVLPGDNMPEMTAKALAESEAMVVLLTPESINSRWVQSDIDYAIGHTAYTNRLVPVIVDSSIKDAPGILKRLPIGVIEIKDPINSEAELKKIASEIKRFSPS